jgi:hypothetical protein
MSSPHPNHEARALSTPAPQTASERANAVRYRPSRPHGHVESLFLKGNAPDGRRALWVKYTILAPTADAERARAELWAVAFRAGPDGRPPVAAKQSFALHEASWSDTPFRLRLPGGEIAHGAARGELTGPACRLRWELRFACPEHEFRPYPRARMYSGPFPRTKTLTPVPDTQLSGFFEVDGERWNVDGWAAAQGHNWGAGHAHAYAWTHCNAFVPRPGSAPCSRVWFEAISGRVRLGPLLTPWLSCAAICVDGRVYRFDGVRSLLSRRLTADTRSYRFELVQGGARLRAQIAAAPTQLAGLRYEDPDGRQLACLNSKLAAAEVDLRADGRTWTLYSERAALEIGTRKADHGCAILV